MGAIQRGPLSKPLAALPTVMPGPAPMRVVVSTQAPTVDPATVPEYQTYQNILRALRYTPQNLPGQMKPPFGPANPQYSSLIAQRNQLYQQLYAPGSGLLTAPRPATASATAATPATAPAAQLAPGLSSYEQAMRQLSESINQPPIGAEDYNPIGSYLPDLPGNAQAYLQSVLGV